MKTAPVLDQDTYEKLVRALDTARWRGINVADMLNRQGLLWTPDRERQVRANAMQFILDEMSTWTPAEFLRRRKKSLESATPNDMYMAIYEWVQEHVAHARTKPD